MNDERLERANKFIYQDENGLRKACLDIPISIDWMAGKLTDFAAEAVSKREREIADELTTMINWRQMGYQLKNLVAYIDQLRKGESK